MGKYLLNDNFNQQSIVLMSHPKSPKPKDDDNKVDDISQEHESIDIGGSSILSMENTPEEALSRPVNTLNTVEENKMACIRGEEEIRFQYYIALYFNSS